MAVVTDATGVANLALQKVGGKKLTTLGSDGTRNDDALDLIYSDTLKEVARIIPWNCLIKRVALVANAGTNLSDYTYMYDVPADMVRILDIENDDTVMYSWEGPYIYCSIEDAELRYIANITTVSQWDSLFLEAFTSRLAAKIAYRLTGKEQLVQIWLQDYMFQLGAAINAGVTERGVASDVMLAFVQNMLMLGKNDSEE
jgi:hypothetical protein